MADKTNKTSGSKAARYKAADPKKYAEWYVKESPFYAELSKGESVELDPKSNFFKNKIQQGTIIKE